MTGVAWFVVGWAVLRANVVSLQTVGVLVGIAFLGVALTQTFLAWMFHGGLRLMHAVLSALFLLCAMWALAARSAFVLLWVGCMAVFRGVQDVTMGVTLL